MATSLVWLRQDLRVSDQPALLAALAEGAAIPVYILDDDGPGDRAIGAAQRWWLHHSLAALAASLEKRGSRLILRRGRSAEVLPALLRETGARRIHALHHYEPWHQAAEAEVAGAADLALHHGNLLAPPHAVLSGSGGRYRVFTPWFAKLRELMPPPQPLPAPDAIAAPESWPASDQLEDWNLLPRTPDWSGGFADWHARRKGRAHRLARFPGRRTGGLCQSARFPRAARHLAALPPPPFRRDFARDAMARSRWPRQRRGILPARGWLARIRAQSGRPDA